MREEYVLWVTFTRSKEDNDKHAPNETQHHEKNMDDARFSTRARAPVLIPSLRYPSVPRRISGVRFRALATAAAVLQAGLSVESACWCQSSSPNRDCWDMNFTTRQSGISTLCLIVSRHTAYANLLRLVPTSRRASAPLGNNSFQAAPFSQLHFVHNARPFCTVRSRYEKGTARSLLHRSQRAWHKPIWKSR